MHAVKVQKLGLDIAPLMLIGAMDICRKPHARSSIGRSNSHPFFACTPLWTWKILLHAVGRRKWECNVKRSCADISFIPISAIFRAIVMCMQLQNEERSI